MSPQINMNVDIAGETITELVEHWAKTSGHDVPAFVSLDDNGVKRSVSRNNVYHFASRFAHRLKKLGAKKGTIICNTLPNSIERVICEFGIIFTGAASMNGQIFRSDGEDFIQSLQSSKSFMVIVGPCVPGSARSLLLHEVPLGCENYVQSTRLPNLEKIVTCSRGETDPITDFITSLEDPGLPEYMETVLPCDLATVMTTSGSTGYSKLVKLTHQNICHFCLQVKAIEPLTSGSNFINCAPLGWAGGYPQWYLSCGITRYFVDMYNGPPKDLPATIWKIILEEKIVYGFVSPMYVNAILSNTSSWQNATWKPRTLCLAGQPVKKSLLGIIGKLCESVDINYGITETNLVSTHRIRDMSTFVDGCAGYPGFGVNIKVVDRDRNELAKGICGEILVSSPSLCQGYLNNDEATNLAFTNDGWLCTDDAGFIGEDGKVYVKGRQSDSILKGAYILYPGWMEGKIKEVEGVKDVAVVAVPDKILFNEICACIVTDGVSGSVVGTLHQLKHQDNHAPTKDKLDNSSSNQKDSISRKLDKNVNIISSTSESSNHITTSNLRIAQSSSMLDRIRTDGTNKSLNVSYSLTTGVFSDKESTKSLSSKNKEDLIILEKKLRKHSDSLQALSENDAMRMVPKYYIFIDKFPLTNTGKLNRKDLRKVAATLLQLD